MVREAAGQSEAHLRAWDHHERRVGATGDAKHSGRHLGMGGPVNTTTFWYPEASFATTAVTTTYLRTLTIAADGKAGWRDKWHHTQGTSVIDRYCLATVVEFLGCHSSDQANLVVLSRCRVQTVTAWSSTRYCKVSARCTARTASLPSRSAMVRATRRTRVIARADRPRRWAARSSNACPAASICATEASAAEPSRAFQPLPRPSWRWRAASTRPRTTAVDSPGSLSDS